MVTWDIEASMRLGSDGILEGPWEGRLLGIKNDQLTIRFSYDNSPDETTVISLTTGRDSSWGGVVAEISLENPN